jgi:hypothetical protein
MANIIVSDLKVSKQLDSIQMAGVSGGSYITPKYPTPKDPMNEHLSYGTNGIVIVGEDKYGGWGGEW